MINLPSLLTGTLLLEDIVNDQLNDMEITVSWTQSAPKNEAYSQLKKVLTGETLKSEIIKKMKIFENSLNKQI